MDLVFITKRRGTLFRLKLRPMVFALGAMGLALGGFGFVSVGYSLGEHHAQARMAETSAQSTDQLAALMASHQQNIDALKTASETSLSALTARIGRLQAEVTRLNALAGQVADAAGLDAEEFRLLEPAALGGVEGSRATVPSWAEAVADLEQVAKAFALEGYRLEAFTDLLNQDALNARTMPAGRPLQDGWMSSGYGYRTDPISGRKNFHSGIDFAGKRNAEVLAVAAGVVTWAGEQPGYGRMVEVTHGNDYITRYAHNRENLVEVGDSVEQGQPIALLGSTGRSTGPHVHFEVVKNGKTVNPWKFINAQRAEVTAKLDADAEIDTAAGNAAPEAELIAEAQADPAAGEAEDTHSDHADAETDHLH